MKYKVTNIHQTPPLVFVELAYNYISVRQSEDNKSWSIHPVQPHAGCLCQLTANTLKKYRIEPRCFFISKREAVKYAKLILAAGKLEDCEREYAIARRHLRTARADNKFVRRAVKAHR